MCVYVIHIYMCIYMHVVLEPVDCQQIPDGAVLKHWAYSVCACDKNCLSEACHVHFYVHDHSTASQAEGWAVGALIKFGITQLA